MEYLDLFLLLEDEKKYFEKMKSDGVYYWHYIRYYVDYAIQEKLFNIMPSDSFVKYDKVKNGLIEKIRNLRFYKKSDILVFCCGRRIKENKFYRCPYTDAWLTECNHSYQAVEFDFMGKHFWPIPTKKIKYLDYIKMEEFVNKYEQKVNIKQIRKDILEMLSDVESLYQFKFDGKIKRDIIGKASTFVKQHSGMKKFYQNIVNKVMPKIILSDGAYAYDRMVLCEVAKENGIPFVELQHASFIGHIAYNFNSKRELKSFPDYMFVYGKFDKTNNKLPIADKYVIPVGSAELEYQIGKLKRYTKKSNKKIIVVISSGDEELLKIAIRLNSIIDRNKYKIIIKLHPLEYNVWEKIFPFLNNKDIDIVKGDDRGIYYYLKMADIIIGSASTACLEASMFDNTSIFITKTFRYEQQLPLVEQKRAILVSDETEILRYIKQGNLPVKKTNYFFADKASKRVNYAINKIINEGDI